MNRLAQEAAAIFWPRVKRDSPYKVYFLRYIHLVPLFCNPRRAELPSHPVCCGMTTGNEMSFADREAMVSDAVSALCRHEEGETQRQCASRLLDPVMDCLLSLTDTQQPTKRRIPCFHVMIMYTVGVFLASEEYGPKQAMRMRMKAAFLDNSETLAESARWLAGKRGLPVPDVNLNFHEDMLRRLLKDNPSRASTVTFLQCYVCKKQSITSCPCRDVRYCGKECQVADWKRHKQSCRYHLNKQLEKARSEAGTHCSFCKVEEVTAESPACPCGQVRYCDRACMIAHEPTHAEVCPSQQGGGSAGGK